MTTTPVRIALGLQALVGLAAIWIGSKLIGWRDLAPQEIIDSPDAHHAVEALLIRWGFLSGACVGLATGLGLLAFVQRHDYPVGGFATKLSWLAIAIPPMVVLGFGIFLWW